MGPAGPVESLWTAAPSTPGFATAGVLRGERRADVVVVGGGAAGLAVALRLQERGAEVIVLERRRVGGGVTGGSTAKVTALHGTRLSEIRRRHGDAAATAYARANQAGLADIRMAISRYGIDCGLTAAPAVDYATTRTGADRLAAELDAYREAGLPIEPRDPGDLGELPFAAEVKGAIALPDQAHIQPLHWCEGMAAAIGRDRVHEATAVEQIDEGRSGVTVVTGQGTVLAEHAVIATHAPIVDPRYLTVRCRPHRSYALAARLEGGTGTGARVPEGMYLSVDEPVRSLRPAVVEGATYLVVAGEGHPVADDRDARRSLERLERWTRDRFAVADVVHRWAAHDQMPSDALPFVGRLVPGGRSWVATGFQKWGLTMSAVAATVVADGILGGGTGDRDPAVAPIARLLDPTRLRSSFTGRLAADVGRVAQRYVGDHVAIRRPPRDDAALVADLAPGDGVVLPVGRGGMAVHRDAGGRLHAVSAVCTHEGCLVRYNRLQTSWDCPCHGSRFSVDGEVLSAPAVADLPRMDPLSEPAGGRPAGTEAEKDRQAGSDSSKTR